MSDKFIYIPRGKNITEEASLVFYLERGFTLITDGGDDQITSLLDEYFEEVADLEPDERLDYVKIVDEEVGALWWKQILARGEQNGVVIHLNKGDPFPEDLPVPPDDGEDFSIILNEGELDDEDCREHIDDDEFDSLFIRFMIDGEDDNIEDDYNPFLG